MQMTPNEREAFAALLQEVRLGRFDGNKKAAYNAGNVNSATWDRLEAGQSVKEHTLARVVSALFPATGGDWRKLLTDDGAFHLDYWNRNGITPEDAGDLEKGLGITEWNRPKISGWDEANAELRELRSRLARAEYRLEKLEEHLHFNPYEGWSIGESRPGRPNHFLVPDDVAANESEGDPQQQAPGAGEDEH